MCKSRGSVARTKYVVLASVKEGATSRHSNQFFYVVPENPKGRKEHVDLESFMFHMDYEVLSTF